MNPPRAPAKVVLCIDDEPSGLLVRSRVLEINGYTVLATQSGSEGLELFRSRPVDVVILDYYMPELSGEAIASEMRRIKPDVPIILLSAFVEVPESTLRLVDRVVVKAQHPDVLLKELELLSAA
jgi:CheY-like chemotaxis protein